MGPQDPCAGWAADGGHLRASDADRERVIDALKVAFVQGRLVKDELARRTGQALESRTYAELAGATAGIPARRAAIPPTRQPAAPVRAPRPVNWKVIGWVAGAIVLTPGLAFAFFATYWGSFFILLLVGFVASGLVTPRTPGIGRHGMY